MFPTITVNPAKDSHIIGSIDGASIATLLVTVHLPVSQSRNEVAHAQLISVPLPVALVTEIGRAHV